VKPRVDHEEWAKQFAKITEEFVWIHSGSSSGGDLNAVFRDALNLLTAYRKVGDAQGAKKPLKREMSAAYSAAVMSGRDPWAAVLIAIADRAEGWAQHISEDTEVTEDIRNWLISEAQEAS
jgi:hypothetical protein